LGLKQRVLLEREGGRDGGANKQGLIRRCGVGERGEDPPAGVYFGGGKRGGV